MKFEMEKPKNQVPAQFEIGLEGDRELRDESELINDINYKIEKGEKLSKVESAFLLGQKKEKEILENQQEMRELSIQISRKPSFSRRKFRRNKKNKNIQL